MTLSSIPPAVLSIAVNVCTAPSARGEERVVSQLIRTFGTGTPEGAACSPGGRYIAACGSQGAFQWDVEMRSCFDRE